MIEYLARRGADMNACLNDGTNLLHLSAAHSDGNGNLAQHLMYFGCHINQSDNRNETPLLVALHEIPHKKNIAIEFSMCPY